MFGIFNGRNFKICVRVLQDLLELTPKKDVLFIIGGRSAKVGSQETPGVTGKFGLGIRNEANPPAHLLRVKCCAVSVWAWQVLQPQGFSALWPRST